MRQTFSVTSPAFDICLVPIERLRDAAGLDVGDGSKDASLLAAGRAASSDIAVACKVSDDGIHPPTLMRETVTETFWLCDGPGEVFLSRRFVSSIAAVTESGSALTTADYSLNPGAGMLFRSNGGRPWAWQDGAMTITYDAGFTTAPDDLQAAVIDVVRMRLSAASQNPLVKSESIEVPDVQTRRLDFWVGALPGSAAAPVPPDILARLSRYQNVFFA